MLSLFFCACWHISSLQTRLSTHGGKWPWKPSISRERLNLHSLVWSWEITMTSWAWPLWVIFPLLLQPLEHRDWALCENVQAPEWNTGLELGRNSFHKTRSVDLYTRLSNLGLAQADGALGEIPVREDGPAGTGRWAEVPGAPHEVTCVRAFSLESCPLGSEGCHTQSTVFFLSHLYSLKWPLIDALMWCEWCENKLTRMAFALLWCLRDCFQEFQGGTSDKKSCVHSED